MGAGSPPLCQEVIPGKDVAPSLAGSPILGKQALPQTKLWAVPQKRLHASRDSRLLLVTGTGSCTALWVSVPRARLPAEFFVSCLPSRAKRAVSTAKRKVFASFGPLLRALRRLFRNLHGTVLRHQPYHARPSARLFALWKKEAESKRDTLNLPIFSFRLVACCH